MCQEKDELYMMMELADTNLHRLIQSSCPLSDGHIRVIMYQILSGVKAMHDNGVLHRDLKPGNLLLNKDCELKITDFGLARMMPKGKATGDAKAEGGDPAAVISPMTEYVVTRWYRPPEIMLAPNGTYNEAVDMWSIGCIFGELLNRKPLFPGSDFIDQLTRVFRVLPVPPRDKRGYEVEGDALAFLESLPPCSPSALAKTLRRASPEALSLLRRLLCVNPERRISARQALAHPYFKAIRAQLGDPPEFTVGRAFDFEFDYQEFPLEHLRSLIQAEVKLLQQDGARAAPSAMKRSEPPQQQQQQQEQDNKSASDAKKETANPSATAAAPVKAAANPAAANSRSDDEDDDDDEEEESETSSLLVESLDGSKDTPAGSLVDDAQRRATATAMAAKEPMGPETDECESSSPLSDRRTQQQQQFGYSPLTYHEQEKERASRHHHAQQPIADSDMEDEPQEVIQVVDRSRRPGTASSSTAATRATRSKSTSASTMAMTARQSSTSSHRDARDEDERHTTATRTRSSSHYSSNNNNESGSSGAEHGERWGHSRASIATTASSSRVHQPIHVSTSSTATTASSRIKTTPISARGSSGMTRASSSNQLKDGGETDKSDAIRHPERVTSSSHRSTDLAGGSATGLSGTTRTTPRSSTLSSSASISSSSSSRAAVATKKETPLPDGWIKRTHSKSGREYYYDTMNKVSSWKHPSKILDNIFGTTRVPATTRPSNNSNNNKLATPTPSSSADSLTPESAAVRAINARRTSLSSGTSTSSAASSSAVTSSSMSGSTMTLPKEWARRTDPKTGRLFYVNLLTNRSFSRLPSSVTSAMLNASKQQQQQPHSQHHIDQPQQQQSNASNNAAMTAKKAVEIKKKLTVPQSPQFSQMSWQRKRVPGSYE